MLNQRKLSDVASVDWSIGECAARLLMKSEDATLTSMFDRLKETRSWIKRCVRHWRSGRFGSSIIRKEIKSLLGLKPSQLSTDADGGKAVVSCQGA